MTRAVKGNFGYLRAKRLTVLIRTVIFFAISLALFAAGYITTGKKENLLTIVAVLGCLPACKSMVNTIMLFRASGCSSQASCQCPVKTRTSARVIPQPGQGICSTIIMGQNWPNIRCTVT